jgi:hypothetical protein
MGAGKREVLLNKQAASSKTILLSRNGSFLFLFGNGAFGSKWCGLWHNDLKFMDYFAWRVNDHWLSPDNFKSLRYNGIVAELDYKAGTNVKEKICMTEGGMVVELQTRGKSEFDLEVGVDIRRRDEDVHNNGYKVTRRNGIHVKNSLGRLSIQAKGVFTPLNQYEVHFPGKYSQEKKYGWEESYQKKFVPGVFSMKGRKVEVRFAMDSQKVKTFNMAKKSARTYVRKHSKDVGWRMAASLSHFITHIDGKTAFMVGFPYFNEFWTRDFLWMAEPLLKKGYVNEVGEAVELIGKHQLKDGSIPNIVGSPGTNADSTPLWIIAADELMKRGIKFDTGKVKKALEFGKKRVRGGIVWHPEELTWMDTLWRRGAIEIQSLWVEAFERGGEIFEDAKLDELAATVWERIENSYLSHEVFKDSLEGPYHFTANALVPIMFGQASLGQRKRTLKRAKEELVTAHGVKAVSNRESGSSEKYHERVWGITTYWGAKALDGATAKKVLSGHAKYLDSRTLYGMPETISRGVPMGATHQLWSIAFLPPQKKGG